MEFLGLILLLGGSLFIGAINSFTESIVENKKNTLSEVPLTNQEDCGTIREVEEREQNQVNI